MNLLPLGGSERKEPLHTWISNPSRFSILEVRLNPISTSLINVLLSVFSRMKSCTLLLLSRQLENKKVWNWYNRLPSVWVISFHQLYYMFNQQLEASRSIQKSLSSLEIEQSSNETLKEFLKRFTKTRLQTNDCFSDMALAVLMNGMRPKGARKSVGERIRKDLTNMLF